MRPGARSFLSAGQKITTHRTVTKISDYASNSSVLFVVCFTKFFDKNHVGILNMPKKVVKFTLYHAMKGQRGGRDLLFL